MTFYPQWICRECGEKYGKVRPGLWCGAKVNLTEPRDYGRPLQPAKEPTR